MADDMENKQHGEQQSGQHGQVRESGQTGQPEQKKGGQGDADTGEDSQNKDRQRRAS